MIKKITFSFLFIFVLTLVSCSKDDDASGGDVGIRPPEWIQGTWLVEDTFGGPDQGFRFTSDDVISLQPTLEYSLKEAGEFYVNAGEEVSVENTSTETFYEMKMNIPGGQTVVYSFELVRDNVIIWKQASTTEFLRQ
ncbi:hypothetical protein [Robertkochia sediminum]|uniref:hypothetical protein n=1 Tax=Robertkochia sediminum TaxID=2785326 RepID=UPI0019320524|nr:hypothetical protein [Robertkochia sediminum]MBL7471407.1 hypothetical protein [Robertkochia sediminum]